MRAFDPTAALAFLFIMLVATASADECLGYCSGIYMCGFSFCFCPAAATESSCPYGCIFSSTGDCSDSHSSGNGNYDDGLSGGAISGIFFVVLVAVFAIAGVIYETSRQQKSKESSADACKTTTNSADVENKKTTIKAEDGTKTVKIHGEGQEPEQALPLNDVKTTTIKPDGTQVIFLDPLEPLPVAVEILDGERPEQ